MSVHGHAIAGFCDHNKIIRSYAIATPRTTQHYISTAKWTNTTETDDVIFSEFTIQRWWSLIYHLNISYIHVDVAYC